MQRTLKSFVISQNRIHIDLSGVEFLVAEYLEETIPIVLIKYRYNNKEGGLRLDLGKRIFIDIKHPDWSEEAFLDIAKEIAIEVSVHIWPHSK